MNIPPTNLRDHAEELLRLLHFPIERQLLEHHAGRVRALAWAVTGVDYGRDVLTMKDEVERAMWNAVTVKL